MTKTLTRYKLKGNFQTSNFVSCFSAKTSSLSKMKDTMLLWFLLVGKYIIILFLYLFLHISSSSFFSFFLSYLVFSYLFLSFSAIFSYIFNVSQSFY